MELKQAAKKVLRRCFDFSRYQLDLSDVPPRLQILPPGCFDIFRVLLLFGVLGGLWRLFVNAMR